jgi:hypothetical protein
MEKIRNGGGESGSGSDRDRLYNGGGNEGAHNGSLICA